MDLKLAMGDYDVTIDNYFLRNSDTELSKIIAAVLKVTGFLALLEKEKRLLDPNSLYMNFYYKNHSVSMLEHFLAIKTNSTAIFIKTMNTNMYLGI